MPTRNTSVVTAPMAASPPEVDVTAAAGGSDGGSDCGTGGTEGGGGEDARFPGGDGGEFCAPLTCGGAAAILEATGGGGLVDDGDNTGAGLAWTATAKSIAVVGTQKEPGLPVVPR